MSLITLSHKKFSGRLYVYLMALSVADLAFLVFAISIFTNVLNSHSDLDVTKDSYVAFYYRVHFETPIANGFLAASVFIIVCMTLDRLIYKILRKTCKQNPRVTSLLDTLQFASLQCTRKTERIPIQEWMWSCLTFWHLFCR